MILLLGILVADLWLTPIGPVFWGISWVPILFFGFILALLLAAADSPSEKRRRYEAKKSGDVTEVGLEHTSLAFSAFLLGAADFSGHSGSNWNSYLGNHILFLLIVNSMQG